MRFVISLGIALAVAGTASAQCRTFNRFYQDYNVVHEDVVVAPIFVPVLTPAFSFQFLGAYSGGIQPQAVAAPQTAAMQPQVQQPAAQTSAQPAAQAPAAPTLSPESIFKSHCASCHTGAGKGGVSIFSAQGQYAPNVPLKRLYAAANGYTKAGGGFTVMPPAAAKDESKRVPDVEVNALLQALLQEK